MPPERSPRRLDRAQLPAEFTPETVRGLDMRTARLLAHRDNGVLTAEEQAAFDRSLREVMQGSTDRLGQTLGRSRRFGPPDVDPELRRSYQRTQRRLDAQAERARQAFPQLTAGWIVEDAAGPGPATASPDPEDPVAHAADPEVVADGVDVDDDVSIGAFESAIEQTSDTLEILEQIAAIQQQQLEHQRSQLLSETRGLFFALAVSVAVIIAGVAPLVEATADQRRLILLWTVGICVTAGLVYAVIRAVQSRPD